MTWRRRVPSVAVACCALLLVLASGIGLGDAPSEEPAPSPVIPGGTPSHREISCPPGYIANRAAYGGWSSSRDDFEIRVQVCVTRDGAVDTYAYLVTNVGLVGRDGSSGETGIRRFDAPAGTIPWEPLLETAPADWRYVGRSGGDLNCYGWEAPAGDPGIEVGESGIFTISYPGPTGPGAGPAYVLLDMDVPHDEASTFDPHVAVRSLGPVASLPEVLPSPGGCPVDRVAYDVAYGTAEPFPGSGFGEVRVEECVTREGGVDTYTYTVTNLSYYYFPWGTTLHRPLGIADFTVPNPAGLEPILVSSPPNWRFDSDATGEWHWSVVPTSGGSTTRGRLWPGDSTVFSFSVEGPTEDGPLEVRAQAQSALLPGDLPDEWRTSDGVTVVSTGPHRQLLERGMGPGTIAESIPELSGCPEGHVSYDVGYGTAASFGEVRVEECVTRIGELDKYTYTVTNLSYVYTHDGERYGIGDFRVPRSTGLVPLSETSPAGWDFDSTATEAWIWSLPEGSVGIWPGDSAVFAFTVAGPTVDGPLDVQALPQFPRPPVPTYYIDDFVVLVPSTGPQPRLDHGPGLGVVPPTTPAPELPLPSECPDLLIESVETDCACGWSPQQLYGCTLEATVRITNQGNADAGPFTTLVETGEGDVRRSLPGLAAGASRQLSLTLSLDEKACPLDYSVKIDVADEVVECDEANNAQTGEACCE